MNRTVFATVICALALVTRVPAEETQAHALAEELLGVMKIQKNIEDSFAMVKQMLPAQMKQMGVPDAEQSENAQKRTNEVLDLIMREMSWDKLKADYLAIYAETLTAGELEGLVKFYKGPIGQKFIEKQPELMKRSMQISQKQMMQILPKIREMAAACEKQNFEDDDDADDDD